jgi:hypothetical protein
MQRIPLFVMFPVTQEACNTGGVCTFETGATRCGRGRNGMTWQESSNKIFRSVYVQAGTSSYISTMQVACGA